MPKATLLELETMSIEWYNNLPVLAREITYEGYVRVEQQDIMLLL